MENIDLTNVLGDTPYAQALGLTPFKDVLARSRFWSRVKTTVPGGRGITLWWLGRRFPVVVLTYYDLRSFLLLERLFPRRHPYVVLLQFIHVTNDSWDAVETRGRLRSRLRRLFDRHVARPVLRRALARGQVLSRFEQERQRAYFGLPPEILRFIPWSLSTPLRHGPPEANGERVGVFASGRAACDWPTVFAIAEAEEWPLTIICGEFDLPEVQRLNSRDRATVFSEISMVVHDRMMRNAAAYLLSLKEANVSSGHLRLATAVQCGTPVVASNVEGISDYVEPGVTAFTFEPGNVAEARAKIRQLIDDRALARAVAGAASAAAATWTPEDYVFALRDLVLEARMELSRR